MAYALAGLGGLRGVGLGGMFAPDCYIASGGADTLGKPQNGGSGMQRKDVPASMLAIYDACEQSASPVTCWGQNATSSPFLGRPCQAEWRAWAAAKIAGQNVGSGPVQSMVFEEEPDNTMLYAGAAALALVGVAGAVYFAKKR